MHQQCQVVTSTTAEAWASRTHQYNTKGRPRGRPFVLCRPPCGVLETDGGHSIDLYVCGVDDLVLK